MGSVKNRGNLYVLMVIVNYFFEIKSFLFQGVVISTHDFIKPF